MKKVLLITAVLLASIYADGQVYRGLPSGVTSPAAGQLDAARFTVNSNGINAQTGTTYTLQASDNGKVITLSNASAITLTVPAGLPVGFSCLIIQLGAGAVTPTASSTTLQQRQSFTKTAGQYAIATLVSYTTNTFILSGDLQ